MKFIDLIFEKLKIWHFAVALVLLVPISSFLLRQNNLTMIELRDKVLEVDRTTGDINKVDPYLQELANYVLNHMNTDIGKVELPGTYNSSVERLRKQVEASGSANSIVYRQAQIKCEDPNIPLTARAQCVQDFVISNAKPGTDPKELVFPDKALYSYSFLSPTWSFDLAGISVLITSLTTIVFVFLLLSRGLMPLLSRMIDRDPLE